MPVKFKVKQYTPGAVYHIYNRGVEGRNIFIDEGDYGKFEEYLKRYLIEAAVDVKSPFKGERPYRIRHKKQMNLNGEVELWAYCLMPNHFHLLVKQYSENGITKLMRRVNTNYVMYFNQKYRRQGTLFSGVYKAVIVGDMEKAVKLTKFIHLNPVNKSVKRFGLVETVTGINTEDYMYSSYQCFINKREVDWVKPREVLGEFTTSLSYQYQSYKQFVEEIRSPVEEGLEGLTLE